MYLNPKLVESSFKRLAPVANTGKKPLERTSALMYFLAFDAATKRLDCCPLDLNPRTSNGKTHRDAMALEFVKLVRLKNGADLGIRQVSVLGKIERGGNSPEKRISSNFFTVPVKKASESAKSYNYPNRPSPLLKMGLAATGLKWGVDYHDSWRNNLPKLLTEMKGNTQFTDLAIFAFRNDSLPEAENAREALSEALKKRYSEDFAMFWSGRMEAEKVFFKHGDDPFRSSYQDSLTESMFSAIVGTSDREPLKSMDKESLIDRIVYLEGLLDAHDIEFQP